MPIDLIESYAIVMPLMPYPASPLGNLVTSITPLRLYMAENAGAPKRPNIRVPPISARFGSFWSLTNFNWSGISIYMNSTDNKGIDIRPFPYPDRNYHGHNGNSYMVAGGNKMDCAECAYLYYSDIGQSISWERALELAGRNKC